MYTINAFNYQSAHVEEKGWRNQSRQMGKQSNSHAYWACEYRCLVFSSTSAFRFLDGSDWNSLGIGAASAPNPSLPARCSTKIWIKSTKVNKKLLAKGPFRILPAQWWRLPFCPAPCPRSNPFWPASESLCSSWRWALGRRPSRF